jgi:hypothetical protein
LSGKRRESTRSVCYGETTIKTVENIGKNSARFCCVSTFKVFFNFKIEIGNLRIYVLYKKRSL